MNTTDQTDSLAVLLNEWLREARRFGPAPQRPGRPPRWSWAARLDLHVHAAHRRPRTLLAMARDIGERGMAVICREALPLYSAVLVGRAGQTEAVAARVLDRTQTVGGYVLELEFQEGLVRTAVAAA